MGNVSLSDLLEASAALYFAFAIFLSLVIGGALLKIDYQDEAGKLNSVAWYVNDLDAFERSIKKQRKLFDREKTGSP